MHKTVKILAHFQKILVKEKKKKEVNNNYFEKNNEWLVTQVTFFEDTQN